jgi:hypothetical protein
VFRRDQLTESAPAKLLSWRCLRQQGVDPGFCSESLRLALTHLKMSEADKRLVWFQPRDACLPHFLQLKALI